MKLVLAVDKSGLYKSAAWLLARLNFPAPEWHVVHVRASLDPILMPLKVLEDEGELLSDPERSEAVALLREAGTEIPATTQTRLLEGAPAPAILKYADEVQADLLAVGSNRHGRIGAMLLGSVGRALALGSKGSFLIARGEVAQTGPVRAIFATDHSDYAKKAMDLFIQMGAKGFSEVIVMTATDMLEMCEMTPYMALMEKATDKGLTMAEFFQNQGEEAVAKLQTGGFIARFEARGGYVSHAVKESMTENSADLLIMGAQGHGFMERLLIGSVALDQVVTSPYSTLVIRSAAIAE